LLSLIDNTVEIFIKSKHGSLLVGVIRIQTSVQTTHSK